MKKISKVAKIDFSYRNQIARQAHFMSGGGLHETKKNKEKSRKGRFANILHKKLKNIKNLRDSRDFFIDKILFIHYNSNGRSYESFIIKRN